VNEVDLRERLLEYAIRIVRLTAALPNTPEARVVRGQLLRAGTSPGAQYREACRARSRAEFISKMDSAQQELDEAHYWLLIVARTEMVKPKKLGAIQQETEELLKISSTSAKTAKGNR